MNLCPVLQHESNRTVGVNDLLCRPAVRRETCFHGPFVLPRAPLPAFRVEMCRLSVLCCDVDRRSQLTETRAVNWATNRLSCLDFSFEAKVWRFARGEANAAFFTVSIVVNIPNGSFKRAQSGMEVHWSAPVF